MALQKDPLVSVVMPVCNCASYVTLAISSILFQSFTDLEFIIIDDGSTDGTSRLLSDLRLDGRARILTQSNMGITQSLGRALKLARGKYIARQDADDISLLMRLETQVRFLESHPSISLVGSFTELIDEQGCCLQVIEAPTSNDAIQQVLLDSNCFIHGSVLMRKESVDKIGGYRREFFLSQDYDLWLRMAEHFEVANIPEVLYQYRKSANSISQRMAEIRRAYIQIAQELGRERRMNGEDLISRGGSRAFMMRYAQEFQALSAAQPNSAFDREMCKLLGLEVSDSLVVT